MIRNSNDHLGPVVPALPQALRERRSLPEPALVAAVLSRAATEPDASLCGYTPLARCGTETLANRVVAGGNPTIEIKARCQPQACDDRGAAQKAVPDVSKSASRRGRFWLAACLLIAALFAGRAAWPPGNAPVRSQGVSAVSSAAAEEFASQAIETIRVGQRVLSQNPDLREHAPAGETAVNPATWRHLSLRAVVRGDDGDEDRVEVETLQTPEWVEANRAERGATVPLPLDLVEMGLPEDLRAEVVDNRSCPAIEGGAGRVVLTTVSHVSDCVGRLVVENARGEGDAVRATAFHKFYREPAGEWVSLEDLRPGDHLGGADGVLTVVAVSHGRSVERVYNMTVEGEHVYYVSALGLLAHNADCKVTKGGGKGLEAPEGTRIRGSGLGKAQGRDFRVDQLETYEFDPNQPKHVRGWLENERRRVSGSGGGPEYPRTPKGYVQAHGMETPAREGFDYSNSRLQGEDLNKLEEQIRRQLGLP